MQEMVDLQNQAERRNGLKMAPEPAPLWAGQF